MVIRFSHVGGLGLALGACGLSAGGLDPNGIEPVVPEDASLPPESTELDASMESSTAGEDAFVADVPDSAPIDPCPVHGTFALTLETDVRWEGTRLFNIVPIIVPGQGQVVVRTLIEIAPEGPSHAVEVRACGASLPDFGASIGETYGADIEGSVWDSLATRWNTRASFGCAQQGCSFGSELVTAQLGIDIPATTPWPSPRDPIADDVQRDDDRDGLPGVRLTMRGPSYGPTYQYPPTSFLLLERVREIQLAIRVGAALDGMVTGCDTRRGVSSPTTLDIRALACVLQDGSVCDDAELGFIDDNLPVWTIQAARFRATRLPTGSTCADVRALP